MKTIIKPDYKICIQCLGCYNSSFLNFRWVNILNDNLEQEIEQLKKSCQCDYIKCDEIEIADYENVPSTFSLNEYEDLKDFIKTLNDQGHNSLFLRVMDTLPSAHPKSDPSKYQIDNLPLLSSCLCHSYYSSYQKYQGSTDSICHLSVLVDWHMA